MVLDRDNPTQLIGPDGTTFDVFSGTGDHINNPDSTDLVNLGPLPAGDYYVVDRLQGGFFGRLWSRLSGRDEWFALYRVDGNIDDLTVVNGVQRGLFRAHAGTRSAGCVTFCSAQQFAAFRQQLFRSPNGTIPGTDIVFYGTITVTIPED
jgi:Tlde1 domain